MPQRAGKRVAQKRGVGEVRDRRLFHHSAILEHGNAIGNAQSELDIVRDQQHAVVLVGEGAEVVQRSDRKVEVEFPGVGSSATITRGSSMSAQQSSTRRAIPPESS